MATGTSNGEQDTRRARQDRWPPGQGKENSQIAVKPAIELIDPPAYGELLEKIERIGRVCYKSEDKIREGQAPRASSGASSSGATSPSSSTAVLTVRVTCDRGISHEIVRHRIASYSQESTRYCNYTADKFGGQIVCIDPATGFGYDLDDPADRRKHELWQEAMEAAERCYFQLIQAGARPEEPGPCCPTP